MSVSSKPITLARIEDATLGVFSKLPPSETLSHLVRFLSTWSGSDSCNTPPKLIIPFLEWRARIQHKNGFRKMPASPSAERLAKLANNISDARMFFRIWGLLPIFQWLISLERNPSPTRKLRTIERLQGWSMLAYYPLEHLYYLLTHSIIPDKISLPSYTTFVPFIRSQPSEKTISLDAGVLGLYSDNKLLKMRERSLSKTKNGGTPVEKEDIRKRREALWNELVVNMAYLPQTIHWSTEKGIFSNPIWLDVCGFVAGVASWRSGWEATALPSPPTSAPDTLPPPMEPTEEKLAPYIEDPLKDIVIEAPGLDEM